MIHRFYELLYYKEELGKKYKKNDKTTHQRIYKVKEVEDFFGFKVPSA